MCLYFNSVTRYNLLVEDVKRKEFHATIEALVLLHKQCLCKIG